MKVASLGVFIGQMCGKIDISRTSAASFEKVTKMKLIKFLNSLLEILFPRKCPVCDQIIMPKGAVICPACRRRVSLVTELRCLKCGKQLFSEEAEYCDGCEKKTFHYTCGLVLMNYDSVARKILTALKYHGKCDNADYLAAETVAGLREEILRMQANFFCAGAGPSQTKARARF